MTFTMPAGLEKSLNALAVSRGLPTVQAVLNRAGASKPERGKIIPFTREPNRWWVGRE